MYNERKESFSFRSFFLTLLLLVLLILLMLFLFPTRWEFKKNCNKKVEPTIQEVKPIEDEVFNKNITRMKEVAEGYYTKDRLPKNVNETNKMTLKEMYNKHLIVSIKDKNGKDCDKNKSYVEITKKEEGYKLKVNLSCPGKEDSIIVDIKDKDDCNGKICKAVTEPTQTVKENINNTNTTTATNTPVEVAVNEPVIVKVKGISVPKNTISLNVGQSEKISFSIEPSNSTNTNTVVTNSNPQVATVSNRVITAKAAGTTTITIKTLDGGYTASIKVTVTDNTKKACRIEKVLVSTDVTLTPKYVKKGEVDEVVTYRASKCPTDTSKYRNIRMENGYCYFEQVTRKPVYKIEYDQHETKNYEERKICE